MSASSFRNAFVYFYNNLSVSKGKFTQEINRLKAENIKLKIEQQKFKNLIEDNKKLRRLLGFQKEHNIKVVPLNVISMAPSRFKKIVIVEGRSKKGTLIIDNNGFLLGKVSKVYQNYSEIILINDPDFYITVKVRNKLGLLKGTLEGTLKVFYIDNKAGIRTGEPVWALSYRTHSSFAVGKVKEALEKKNDFFMDITVKPYAKLYPYKTVFAVE